MEPRDEVAELLRKAAAHLVEVVALTASSRQQARIEIASAYIEKALDIIDQKAATSDDRRD